MEKTLLFIVKLNTKTASVNRAMFEEVDESGIHFIDEVEDGKRSSIDSTAETIRDWMGEMLEYEE